MVRFMSVPSPTPEKLISLTVGAKTACDYDYQSQFDDCVLSRTKLFSENQISTLSANPSKYIM